MKDKSPNLQTDSMISQYIHSQDKGVTQPSLKELASRFFFDSDLDVDTDGLVLKTNPQQDTTINFSPSDVAFVLSAHQHDFDSIEQPINLQNPIKEG